MFFEIHTVQGTTKCSRKPMKTSIGPKMGREKQRRWPRPLGVMCA